jgi:hypothetical protein
VILAESKDDLEEALDVAFRYSYKWRFKYNYDKCAVVIFSNGSKREEFKHGNCLNTTCTCGHHFIFGSHLINEVLVYKYLGVELDYRLSYQGFKDKIFCKSRTNLSRIWKMGISSGYFSVKASLHLWEALCRSILDYASEIWGDEIWLKGEQMQLEMGRRVLRCSSKTTNEAVRGDLGLMSLRSRRDLKKLMYWIHLLSSSDNRLIKQVYIFSKQRNKKSNWAGRIKRILIKYGLHKLWSKNELVWNVDGFGNNMLRILLSTKCF